MTQLKTQSRHYPNFVVADGPAYHSTTQGTTCFRTKMPSYQYMSSHLNDKRSDDRLMLKIEFHIFANTILTLKRALVSHKQCAQFVECFLDPVITDVITLALYWRHNERDGVSNHQPNDCLLNRLFRRRSKKTSKLRVTGLCAGNPLVTGEFPAQRASNTENVSILWRHHDAITSPTILLQLEHG